MRGCELTVRPPAALPRGGRDPGPTSASLAARRGQRAPGPPQSLGEAAGRALGAPCRRAGSRRTCSLSDAPTVAEGVSPEEGRGRSPPVTPGCFPAPQAPVSASHVSQFKACASGGLRGAAVELDTVAPLSGHHRPPGPLHLPKGQTLCPQERNGSRAHLHTRAHVCTHTHMHTRTHVRTHARAYALTCTHMHACTRTHAHTHAPAYTHTRASHMASGPG